MTSTKAYGPITTYSLGEDFTAVLRNLSERSGITASAIIRTAVLQLCREMAADPDQAMGLLKESSAFPQRVGKRTACLPVFEAALEALA